MNKNEDNETIKEKLKIRINLICIILWFYRIASI